MENDKWKMTNGKMTNEKCAFEGSRLRCLTTSYRLLSTDLVCAVCGGRLVSLQALEQSSALSLSSVDSAI